MERPVPLALGLQLGRLGRPELGCPAGRGAVLLGGHGARQAVGERAQGELGIGDQADGDGEVLGDLVGVEVDVHHRCPFGEDAGEGGEDLREDVGAADHDGIGSGGNGTAVVAEHMPEHPLEQRVGVVHVDLGPVGAPHRGAPGLGEAGQLRLGSRHRHAVSRDDHGPAGARQQ